MKAMESEVRGLLRALSSEIHAVDALSHKTRLRVKKRRLGTVMGGGVLVAALVLGGFMSVDALTGRDPAPPAHGDEDLDREMRGGRGSVIAQGEARGYHWEYRVYKSKGNVCDKFAATSVSGDGDASGGFCPIYRRGSKKIVHLGIGSFRGQPGLVHGDGWVSDEVARLILRSNDGEREEVTLYPPPRGMPFPISFFVIVPVSEDADALVALDEAGERLGCWKTGPVPDPHDSGGGIASYSSGETDLTRCRA